MSLSVAISLPLDRYELKLDFATNQPRTGVFGPSGSGKTSLLQSVAGLRRGVRGRIQMGSEIWLDSDRGIFVPPERRHVGYVPQDGLLFPHKDVRQNLLAGAARARVNGNSLSSTFAAVAELLELAPLLDRDVVSLSGGERQRVALGRAICSGPRLLLLDEPLASLDIALRRRVLPFLRRVLDEFQIPMIFVSHEPSEVQALCEDLIVLHDGAVVRRGQTRKVLTDPAVFPLATPETFENLLPCKWLGEAGASGQVLLLEPRSGPVSLWTSPTQAPKGTEMLVGIPAREIIIAMRQPERVSAQNILPARVVAVNSLGDQRLVLASLDPGVPDIAIEVTERACQQLEIQIGDPVYLIIKAAGCILYHEKRN